MGWMWKRYAPRWAGPGLKYYWKRYWWAASLSVEE